MKKQKVIPPREATFSSFRVGVSSKGMHRLEVRDHTQEWKRDSREFKTKLELKVWLSTPPLRMRLHGDGPYLEDAKHPGKFPCWHAGFAKELKLKEIA